MVECWKQQRFGLTLQGMDGDEVRSDFKIFYGHRRGRLFHQRDITEQVTADRGMKNWNKMINQVSQRYNVDTGSTFYGCQGDKQQFLGHLCCHDNRIQVVGDVNKVPHLLHHPCTSQHGYT